MRSGTEPCDREKACPNPNTKLTASLTAKSMVEWRREITSTAKSQVDKPMSNDDVEIIRKAVDQLGEHFDSVQIFCTRHEGAEGTGRYAIGGGNWFARYGQIVYWLHQQQEDARQEAREDREEDD